MKKLDINETKEFYERAENVWSNSSWYKYSYSFIYNYIHCSALTKCQYIFNAGSAGNTYDLNCRMHHMDIAKNKIEKCDEYTIGSIESIPLENNTFDGVICVGSVINYTDAIISISELIRIADKNGIIVLEFENSNSFEYLFKKVYKSDATIIDTEYLGNSQKQWIYSYEYITSVIRSFKNIEIVDITGFHILDSLFAKQESIAKFFNKYEESLNKNAFMKKHAGNIILTLKKL